ncbi:DNA binding protein [Phytophthora megakarya]|uniref:DNA binding protein n=1 Tax=Phytophthora megakarya TaxID=4795 RepID=A0A225W1M6_9STRA|nr:DNA binding protein [Phytophthora megakarya]
MWHRRLGHVNYETLQRMAKSGTVNGMRIATGAKPKMCTVCALTKATRQPVPKVRSSSDKFADGICHVDLAGPIAASINGNRYFMLAVWRYYVQTYALKHKNDATNMTKRFIAMIERQAEVPATAIKVLRTDRGT